MRAQARGGGAKRVHRCRCAEGRDAEAGGDNLLQKQSCPPQRIAGAVLVGAVVVCTLLFAVYEIPDVLEDHIARHVDPKHPGDPHPVLHTVLLVVCFPLSAAIGMMLITLLPRRKR